MDVKDYAEFFTGWILAKIPRWVLGGLIGGLGSEIVFRPLSKKVWRFARKRLRGYFTHHKEDHEPFRYKDCPCRHEHLPA